MTNDVTVLEGLIRTFSTGSEHLLPLLHKVQEAYACIPEPAFELIASHFNLSRAEVHGVVSFYHDFSDQPRGEYQVQLCCAEACQAVGSRALQRHVEKTLDIALGGKTTDGKINLNAVYCLGNCACGPSVRINGAMGDRVYGRVDAQRFDEMLVGILAEGQS